MGEVNGFTPARLVMGVLSTDEGAHPELFSLLEEGFGPILEMSEAVPFSFTDYYDREMGASPSRFFLVFERLLDPSLLAQAKLFTNTVEERFKKEGGRTINLDPGLLTAANLVLATTKNRAHRIALEQGIYAEVTLIYQKGRFNALPWTYADYKSEAFCQLFKRYRSEYLNSL
ncbi:DUF4416 family protein [Sphaerochaeta sp. PS]|uniref:DUF4416 family protein n=1 Tax=Sphaerochaeta sp. PS TaxID=3076336 RepID=UPI0028A2EA18|nr:DUF4416 family protein [Sphaerochaeta sp. PS]MDT4762492.1 DUF4416 family protein [Sphaerochaeta sp. PS]